MLVPGFSLVLVKNRAVSAAIASIPEDAWTPVHYPGAVPDPETGEWISDAQVAEIPVFTAFCSTRHPVTARLIVRRVRDRAHTAELFPVWRHHPFFTNSTEPAPAADITHRRHAIIQTVFADLIDGPLAHRPSGRFAANSAWTLCAAITHNLLRAAATMAGPAQAVERGGTLRRTLINVPARIARPQGPQGQRVLHLPDPQGRREGGGAEHGQRVAHDEPLAPQGRPRPEADSSERIHEHSLLVAAAPGLGPVRP